MKNLILSVICLSILCFTLNGQNDITLNIDHQLNGSAFGFSSAATAPDGDDFNVTRLEYYVSQIEILHDGGITTAITDTYLLVNPALNNVYPLGNFSIDSIEEISFYIGVESAKNHADPSTYSSGHPLAPKSPSMHWGWTSGYRFLAIEGKAGSTFNLTYEIHALGDVNYYQVVIPTAGIKNAGNIDIDLIAEYDMILKSIDVGSAPVVHSISDQTAVNSLVNMQNDVFTAKNTNSVQDTTSTGIEDIMVQQNWIQVFPNPADDIITIEIPQMNHADQSIQVLDINGKSILQKTVTQDHVELDVSHLSEGIYFIQHSIGSALISTKRMVVAR